MGVIRKARGNMSVHFAENHTATKPCALDRVKGGGRSRDVVESTLLRGG